MLQGTRVLTMIVCVFVPPRLETCICNIVYVHATVTLYRQVCLIWEYNRSNRGYNSIYCYMQNLFTSYTGWIHHERFKTNSRTACQTWKKVRPWNRIDMQRIVYLDTNILGQPHTYFVSKLPGATDREKIQEAFGLSDETLQESLRFNVGQWLLISHSATGVDDLPIPVQIPDANVRINDFLNNFSKTEGSRQ